MGQELKEINEKLDIIIKLLSDGNNRSSSNKNPNPDAPMQVVNFIDPQLFDDYLKTSDGQKSIVNTIKKNKNTINNTLK